MNKKQQADIIQLYQDTSGELRRLLTYKLGNQQEAEEIAQDAYLKLMQVERAEDIRDLRRYLFSTAVHLTLNLLRRRKTERNYQCGVNDREFDPADLSPYRILLGELKLEAVKSALNELPEKTRYIFLLHRFEDVTYAEIARRLGLSMKAVEYHMNRALAKVLQAVEELTELDE